MAALCKLEDIPTVFAPHIEELREFFGRRGVLYGSPDKITPFVERVEADATFRDEMASMVRAIMYRVRDGLARLELLELLLVTVGGTTVGDASEELHEPVRRMLAFLDTVFKSRWHAMKDLAHDDGEPAAAEEAAKPVEARKLAWPDASAMDGVKTNGPVGKSGVEPALDIAAAYGDSAAIGMATAMHVAAAMESAYRAEPAGAQFAHHDAPHEATVAEPLDVMHTPLLLRGHRAPLAEREWHTRGEERILPAVPYESEASLEAVIAEERTPRRWFWTAGFCVLVVAFCVGLFFVERAADMPVDMQGGQVATAAPQPIASDLAASHGAEMPPAPANAKPAPNVERMGTAHPEPTSAERPAGGATPAGRTRQFRNVGQVRYTPTALFGVSPGIMRGHLLYAPEPEYPRMARLAHIEGQVAVEAVVTREGWVSQANVLSGHRLLRNAALHAVRTRRYRPYLVNGRPTDVATILTVDFRMK